jgi:hypothetical protein
MVFPGNDKRRNPVKKFFLLAVAILFIFSAVCYGADTTGPDYYAMVKQLKSNDLKVDFKALRLSYTKTPDYQPYGGETAKTGDAAVDALNKKDYKEAIRLAEAVLEKNFVDFEAHMICQMGYRELGSMTKYAFHRNILKGLVSSLYASGDGLTPETAMIVITTREEYFFMSANGLRKIKQSLVKANDHSYDRMDVENAKTGEKKTIYFNIDIPYGWLSNSMQKK